MDLVIEEEGVTVRKLLRKDRRPLQTVADGDWINGGIVNDAAGRLFYTAPDGN